MATGTRVIDTARPFAIRCFAMPVSSSTKLLDVAQIVAAALPVTASESLGLDLVCRKEASRCVRIAGLSALSFYLRHGSADRAARFVP